MYTHTRPTSVWCVLKCDYSISVNDRKSQRQTDRNVFPASNAKCGVSPPWEAVTFQSQGVIILFDDTLQSEEVTPPLLSTCQNSDFIRLSWQPREEAASDTAGLLLCLCSPRGAFYVSICLNPRLHFCPPLSAVTPSTPIFSGPPASPHPGARWLGLKRVAEAR